MSPLRPQVFGSALGFRCREETSSRRFEKVQAELKGVYQAINQAFVSHSAQDVSLINREQDMDEPVQVGGFTAGRILGFYGDEDILASVLNEVPVAFGFAIPLDFGFTYDWREIFTFGLALRNVNGEYHMQTYSGTNQLYYMLTGGYIGSSPPGEAETGVSYSFHTPMSLDVGIALRTPDGGFWDWVDMTFAFDVVDVWDLLFVEKPTLEGFISRMRTGVELSLMRTFDFRFGLNAGYMSFGFTFDFQIMTIDLTYATLEYGDATGDKPLDLFSIAFRIGLEN